MHFDQHARTLWRNSYPQLTHPADGLPGHLTARAEAHTIRLALIYALIDGQTRIYSNTSKPRSRSGLRRPLRRLDARDRTGDPIAEQIHAALCVPRRADAHPTARPLPRNLPAQRLDQALANLAAAGRATHQRTLTTGRPAELWTATPPPEASTTLPLPGLRCHTAPDGRDCHRAKRGKGSEATLTAPPPAPPPRKSGEAERTPVPALVVLSFALVTNHSDANTINNRVVQHCSAGDEAGAACLE